MVVFLSNYVSFLWLSGLSADAEVVVFLHCNIVTVSNLSLKVAVCGEQ